MIELTPFSIVIVVAGLLGDMWGILASTVVMNIVTIVVLLVAPRAIGVAAVLNQEMPLILPVALVHQWAFAILTIALWRNFQRTLGEVGTAYERAKQLDVLKDEFIASVNHELRTPLMTMQTYLETLRESHDRLAPEQVSLALEQACRVSDSLVDLVKSILSTRRIDQDAVGFVAEPVVVADALAAAISLVNLREASLDDRELRISVPDELTIWGEHVRLQQILTNLLANAAKYSPAGTPIEVVAQLVQQGGIVNSPWRRDALTATAEIRVRDYGQGIPPDQIPLLFNRFVRLPRDLASKITGTGLGLYLCRVLAEAMDGRVWVESTGVAGEGSTFILRLPAVAPDGGGGSGRTASLVKMGTVHDAIRPRSASQADAAAGRLTGSRAP
jgi:signal transduction histidine kinase